MSLTEEQASATTSLEDLLNQMDGDGSYKYPRRVVRDLIAMFVIDHGLEVTAELQEPMIAFFADAGLGPADSAEDFDAGIRAYFAANPVDPQLILELGSFGRDLLLTRGEGFQDKINEMKALMRIGRQGDLQAPAEDPQPRRPVIKKGLGEDSE